MTRSGVAFFLSIVAFAGLGGCVSVRSSHGYILERGSYELTAEAGLDTKESVLAKYGEPSMIGTFNPNAWYYMASTDRARAFFRPETQYREIVAFYFSDAGVVTEVKNLNLSDAMDVKVVSRTTPTRGKELGFWEQLLGNVGRLPATPEGGPGGGPPQ
jgi:outer membrane protein assembly factor BamE (lipoprotein component of BamABCDE complex)